MVHIEATPAITVPHLPSHQWDNDYDSFISNEPPSDGEVIELRRDRALHTANRIVLDAHCRLLKKRIETVQMALDCNARKVDRIDSALHVLRRLPDDTLLDIFYACQSVSSPSTTVLTSPWTIAMVCRRWRAIALGWGASHLWTSVSIDLAASARCKKPVEPLERMIDLHLSRSRLHPIKLYLPLTGTGHNQLTVPHTRLFASSGCLPSFCTELSVVGRFRVSSLKYIHYATSSLHRVSTLSLQAEPKEYGIPHEDLPPLLPSDAPLNRIYTNSILWVRRCQLSLDRLTVLDVDNMHFRPVFARALRDIAFRAPLLCELRLSAVPDVPDTENPVDRRLMLFPHLRTLVITETNNESVVGCNHPISNFFYRMKTPSLVVLDLTLGVHTPGAYFQTAMLENHLDLISPATELRIRFPHRNDPPKHVHVTAQTQFMRFFPNVQKATLRARDLATVLELLSVRLPLLKELILAEADTWDTPIECLTALVDMLQKRKMHAGFTVPGVRCYPFIRLTGESVDITEVRALKQKWNESSAELEGVKVGWPV